MCCGWKWTIRNALAAPRTSPGVVPEGGVKSTSRNSMSRTRWSSGRMTLIVEFTARLDAGLGGPSPSRRQAGGTLHPDRGQVDHCQRPTPSGIETRRRAMIAIGVPAPPGDLALSADGGMLV